MPSDRLCRRGEICAAKLDRMPIPHRLIALRCPPRPWPTARRFHHALVAQPDRVVASEAIGRGFESLRARHLPSVFAPACHHGVARWSWIHSASRSPAAAPLTPGWKGTEG